MFTYIFIVSGVTRVGDTPVATESVTPIISF